MPTGYTAAVADGKITDLPAFALRCARAFGATVDMRDDNMDAPIPERFEPSGSYRRFAALATDRLLWLQGLSPIEAQRAMQQEHSAAMAAWRERSIEDAKTRVRYQAMLDAVTAWNPPGQDHLRLKDFMLEQIQTSIKHDCGGEYNRMPRLKRWPEWLRDKKAETIRAIERHNTADLEELDRVEKRNIWMRQLRASLLCPTNTTPGGRAQRIARAVRHRQGDWRCAA